jgi:hypothetical protein
MSNLSRVDAQASISTPPSTPILASRQGQNAKYISGRRTLHALLLAHHTAYFMRFRIYLGGTALLGVTRVLREF